MGECEHTKLRYNNKLENYLNMREAGLTPPEPYFINRHRICYIEIRSKRRKICSSSQSSTSLGSPILQVMNGCTSITNGSMEDHFLGFTVEEIRWKPSGYKMLLETIKKLEKEIEELENEGAESRNKKVQRYPRRAIPYKNYTEDDVPNDDDYIFCDDCDNEWEGDCLLHGPLIPVEDNKVPSNPNDPTRAERTLPPMLVIAQSSIPNAGKGVWTKEPIMKRLRFGPYEGIISDISNNNGYCWQVFHNRHPSYCIDAYLKGTSNWMRYVNCARHVDEQNLIAFQYKGKIYYRTLYDIAAHVELLVWYGEEFGRELGIDLATFQKPRRKYLQDAFPCSMCAACFPSYFFLQKHICSKKKYMNHNDSCEHNNGMKCPAANNKVISNMEASSSENNKQSVENASYLDTNNITNKQANEKASIFQRSVSQQRKICVVEKCPIYKVRLHLDKAASHTPTEQYSDNICRYQCNKAENQMTLKRIHITEKPYLYDICDYKSNEARNLKTHKRIHTGEKPYSCDICEYKCSEAGHLKTHKRIHTGKKTYSCDICDFNFSQAGSLKTHKRIHTEEKSYSCDICKYKCNAAGDLKTHKRIHTGEKSYSCDICDFKFSWAADLKRHIRIHTGEKPYSCDICDFKFSQAAHLKTHKRIHTGEKPYSCDICEYKCSVAGALKTHKRKHTGEKPYSCDICEYKFSQAGDLKTHKRIHTGEKPYSCDICEYKCSQAGNLKTHKRIHTGEKPYSCDICDFKSNWAGCLKRHKSMHTGEKPYSCDICDFKSYWAGYLKRHKRIHTGEKPYSCDICGYKCNVAGSFKTHKRIHTGGKLYSCDNISG